MAKAARRAAHLLQFVTGKSPRLPKMLAHPKHVSFWRGHKLHVLVAMLVLTLHGVLVYALWRFPTNNLPATPVVVRLIQDSPPTTAPLNATPSIASRRATQASHGKATLTSKTALPTPQPMPMPVFRDAPVENAAHSTPPTETITAGAPVSGMGDIQPNSPGLPRAPVGVSGDVSLACPVRSAPVYPTTARRLGEAGTVVLRIEIDEAGQLVASDIARSSGFSRLDEAAQAAVKRWRCRPAMRDGQALRTVSVETFDFRLGD